MASDLVAKLGVDSTGWNAGFAQARSTATSFGSSISSMASSLLSPLGVAAAAGAAALGGIWGGATSVSAFKESLEAQRKLSAVIEATGGAAGLTTQDITAFAAEMQTLTNFEDDATTASAAVLAAFTNIRGQTFTDTIESAMDLTTVMGGELTDNVKLLGKALNDPIDGVKKLAKAGVQLTQAQEQQVESLQKSGDLMGAQTVLLDALQSKFGGAAQAVADPWKQLQNTFGDVAENIGSLLLPSINVIASAVNGWLGPIASSGDAFLDFGAFVAANLATGIELATQFATTVGEFISAGAQMASEAFGAFLEMIGLGDVTFQDAISAVMVYYSHITQVIALIGTAFQLGFVQIGANAMHLFTAVLPAYAAWFAENWYEIIVTLASNALTVFENIGTNIKNIWTAVLDFFSTGTFKVNWKPLTDGFINTVKELPKVADREVGTLENGLAENFATQFDSLTTSMQTQFKEVSEDIDTKKADILKKFETTSKVPAGTLVADAEGKNHDGNDKDNGAASRGSKEAAKIITFGARSGIENILNQQLVLTTAQLKEIKLAKKAQDEQLAIMKANKGKGKDI